MGNTNTTRKKYQRIAALYDLLDLPFETRRYRPIRGRLFEGVRGRVLDAGVGTGRNIAHYPPGTHVTGIDLSGAMLARAGNRLARHQTQHGGQPQALVELLEMDVMHTTFPDNHFDAITASFLCCVLDGTQQLPALIEMGRICKPGGTIRIMEYAYSEHLFKRAIMRLWAPWVRWAYGATFDRNTEQYVEAAGLTLLEQRNVFQDIIKLLVVTPREQPGASAAESG